MATIKKSVRERRDAKAAAVANIQRSALEIGAMAFVLPEVSGLVAAATEALVTLARAIRDLDAVVEGESEQVTA